MMGNIANVFGEYSASLRSCVVFANSPSAAFVLRRFICVVVDNSTADALSLRIAPSGPSHFVLQATTTQLWSPLEATISKPSVFASGIRKSAPRLVSLIARAPPASRLCRVYTLLQTFCLLPRGFCRLFDRPCAFPPSFVSILGDFVPTPIDSQLMVHQGMHLLFCALPHELFPMPLIYPALVKWRSLEANVLISMPH